MYSSPYSSPYGTGMYGTGGLYGGGAYGGYGGAYGGGMYGSPYNRFGMMGAPGGVGLLSGVNQSVEQVGRISTVLQMASEALHMTFSSGVRLFANLGMFSNEMGSVASALTAFHFLSRIYLKLKEKFLRMIGKQEAADEVKLKAAWEHPSQQEGADQNSNPNDPQNQITMLQHQQQQIHQTGNVSWISVFAAIFGILYLIKRIFRFFFPKRAPKPVLPPQRATMPNGQAVHIISTPGGRHFVVSPQGQRCPVVSAVTGAPLSTSLLELPPGHGLAMVAPNGQSIPLRLAVSSPTPMPSIAAGTPLQPGASSTSSPVTPQKPTQTSSTTTDESTSSSTPVRADASGPAPSWLSSSSDTTSSGGVVNPSLPTSAAAVAGVSPQLNSAASSASPALNSAISSFSGGGGSTFGTMGSPYGGVGGGLGGYGSPYGSAYGTPGIGMGMGAGMW